MAYSDHSDITFTAPLFLGCLFPAETEEQPETDTIDYNKTLLYETLTITFLDLSLRIRQFDAHPTNANALWPEATYLGRWITTGETDADIHTHSDENKRQRIEQLLISPPVFSSSCSSPPPIRILELGSATGALCIYLRHHGVNITSSDLDDSLVTHNIIHNYQLNQLVPQHLPHTWGQQLHTLQQHLQEHGYYQVILGSDLLAYEDQYSALADTVCTLLPEENNTEGVLYLCWKRRKQRTRGGKKEGRECSWFSLIRQRGFSVVTHKGGIYEIRRRTQHTLAETPEVILTQPHR